MVHWLLELMLLEPEKVALMRLRMLVGAQLVLGRQVGDGQNLFHQNIMCYSVKHRSKRHVFTCTHIHIQIQGNMEFSKNHNIRLNIKFFQDPSSTKW
jgi:hypothetical protein